MKAIVGASGGPAVTVHGQRDEAPRLVYGHPFFAGLHGAEIAALPTGNWPVLSEPEAVADVLHSLAA